MIEYIGDISKEDAQVLADLAINAKSILEFGVGATTQVLRHYSEGSMTSLDTNPMWVSKTIQNLANLGIIKEVVFLDYRAFFPTSYDLIFDDGIAELRLEFALKTWRYLSIGGFLVFHDTRRLPDMQNVCRVIEAFYPEMETIELNKNKSNLTVIKKKEPAHFEDWGFAEGRTRAQLGY